MKIDCLKNPDETGRMVEQFQLAILLLYEIKRIWSTRLLTTTGQGACYGTKGPTSSIHCIITVFCEEDGGAAESFRCMCCLL
jgi:hypothetical protein